MAELNIPSTKELEFALFCIDFVARKLAISPDMVYKQLKESGLLQNYILDNYEMLHTLGKDYLVEEMIILMKERELI